MRSIKFILAFAIMSIGVSCKKSESSEKLSTGVLRASTDLCAFLSTPLRSDMYAYDGQQNLQQLQCYGISAIGDTTPEQWYFNSSSTATTNGTTVIQPTSMTGSGRWLFLYKVPAASKRQETYSGSSNASGIYSVTYPVAFASGIVPNIQSSLISGNNKETMVVTSTNTGFSILVQTRNDVVGLLPTYSNVSGRTVQVLITQP